MRTLKAIYVTIEVMATV